MVTVKARFFIIDRIYLRPKKLLISKLSKLQINCDSFDIRGSVTNFKKLLKPQVARIQWSCQ